MMSYQEFSDKNLLRCESPKGFNHKIETWTASDWMLALLGELGEAANVIKKFNRIRDGVHGNKENIDELSRKLQEELGDTFVYFDLLCRSMGFNAFHLGIKAYERKSKELGYNE
jgi:NTP pyrophosphatase (non-canonical NTP hydrolase)